MKRSRSFIRGLLGASGFTGNVRDGLIGLAAGGGGGPAFLSLDAISLDEGSDQTVSITVDQLCDITISGGADANQFQLSGNLNTLGAQLLMFAQATTGTLHVTILATSVATGLTVTQNLTVTVVAIAAPTPLAAPTVANLTGGAWEGSTLVATPGTYTGATDVTGQWQRGGPGSFVDIAGERGLTYRRAEADINAGTIRYVETAVSAPSRATVQNSNAAANTISGVIAQMAMYDVATDISAAPRWAELIPTTTTLTAHMPDAGPGKGDGTVGYDAAAPGFASFVKNQVGFPIYLRGQANTTGVSGRVWAGVPNGQALRIKIAAGGGGAGPTTNEWSVRDGDAGTELAFAQHAAIPTSSVLGADGLTHLATDWLAEDAGVVLPPFTSGVCSIRRRAGGAALYSNTLRAFQISYPEYALNLTTTNLPAKTAYSDIASGNDATGDGKTATPFQHLVGEPGATGLVPTFIVSSDGFNKARSGTYYAINKTARGGNLVVFSAGGTVGHPATLASDTGAAVILDGSTTLASWGPVAPGDTGGAWENPFKASIEKYTGAALTGTKTPLVVGDDHMFPSQFPNPANPADYDMAYEGTDAFMTMNPATFAAKVTPNGGACAVDGSAGTGYIKVIIVSDSGANNVKDRYGPDAISLNGTTAIIMINGNRLLPCIIADHNPATGSFAACLKDTEAVFTASTTTSFKYAIRGHVFDIRQTGQYAYVGATPYGAFEAGTRGRIDPLLVNGFKPAFNHLTIDGSAGAGGYMTIRRAGVTSAGIKDNGTGSTPPQGITIKGVHLKQIRDGFGRVVSFKAGSVGNYSTITLKDLKVTECQGQPGIETMPGINGDGIYLRDLNGTGLYIGSPAPSGARAVWKNLNICDMSGIHANGIAAYTTSGYYDFLNAIIANVGICLSTQGGDGTTPRNLSFKDMWAMGRLAFPGQVNGATLYGYQYGEGEVGATLEGIFMPNDAMFYGHSWTTLGGNPAPNVPSPGTLWKNCVFGDIIAHNRLDTFAGITMQDCLVLGKSSGGGGLASVADFIARGGNDGGGNVVIPHSSYVPWAGGLTLAMQQALTVNHGLGTYTQRNIGNEATAFGGTGQALIVPAAGAAFTLADTLVSTDVVRKKFRVGLHGGVLMSPEPDVTYDLPAGQGDNALFALDAGNYWRFTGDPTGAAVRHLVVDKTTSNGLVTGGSTKRTDISINLV